MQKDFCYEDGALFVGDAVEAIIPRIRGLIEKATRKKVHLIFTQDWHSPDDEEFEVWGRHCVRDTRGAEIIDELFVNKNQLSKKKKYLINTNGDIDSYGMVHPRSFRFHTMGSSNISG